MIWLVNISSFIRREVAKNDRNLLNGFIKYYRVIIGIQFKCVFKNILYDSSEKVLKECILSHNLIDIC